MKKLLITIFKTLFFFISWALILPLFPEIDVEHQSYLRLWWEFIPFITIILLTFIFIYIIERHKIKVSILSNFFQNFFRGLSIGALWLMSIIIVFNVTNIIHIQDKNNITHIWVWCLASLLNVAMQELLVRGYLYQLWKKKFHASIATIITTLLFTIMHAGVFEGGIVPVLNIITMSIFMTLLLEYTGTIIAPIIAHFVWNTGGGIIFGVISLAEDYPSLFNTEYHGITLLSGGSYGIEGSVVVLILHMIFIIALSILLYKTKTRSRGERYNITSK